ncbi:MAG: OadG family protein [Lachnospiraceae bacterium]|nr:OadG family protein [Lachnospiraceae bacterium]
MKKKVSFILCILTCALLVAGCNVSLTKQNKNFNEKKLEKETDKNLEKWFGTDHAGQSEQLKSAIEYYDGMKDQLSEDEWNSYLEQRDTAMEQIAEYDEAVKYKKKYGSEMDKKVKTEFTISADSATVNETIRTTEGKQFIYSVSYDKDGNKTTEKIEEYKTMKQKMARAGLNTVMSITIVFVVLLFISFIISGFKIIGVVRDGRSSSRRKQVKVAPIPVAAPASAPTQAKSVESTENLVDDLELVAVITAAIAAATESESADGLIVRSIVRR